MGATYRHIYGHDAKAIAEARRQKNRERLQRRADRAIARGEPPPQRVWNGEVPRDWAGVGDEPVIEEKRKEEPKPVDPLAKLRQNNRVPVEVIVHMNGEPMRFLYSTNILGTLTAGQRSEDGLRERIGKVLKDSLG